MTRRCFGLDVHREFAQVAIWQDGRVRHAGEVPATPEGLRRFADSLAPSEEVGLEATCNTHAIAKLPHLRGSNRRPRRRPTPATAASPCPRGVGAPLAARRILAPAACPADHGWAAASAAFR